MQPRSSWRQKGRSAVVRYDERMEDGRWKAMGAPVDGECLRVDPDLVVEVLSRSTRARDRRQEKRIYERNAVVLDGLQEDVSMLFGGGESGVPSQT